MLKGVGLGLRGAIYDLRLSGEERRAFADLLEDLVALHDARADSALIELDVQSDLPSGSLGSRGTEVLRIVGEALTNARRHAGAKSIRVTSEGSPGLLKLRISDDGIGFDAGSGAGSPERVGIEGMHERARLLGAELAVDTDPDVGTDVRFEMRTNGGLAAELVRILLVEDHSAVREAIAAMFEREPDFEVVSQAASLAEARGMLEDVDVAVVDLGLPDGYGGDLIGELRDKNPRAQALVLSATLDRAETARAVESGAAGVLDKTAHLDEVVHAVRRLRVGKALIPVEEVAELLRAAGASASASTTTASASIA